MSPTLTLPAPPPVVDDVRADDHDAELSSVSDGELLVESLVEEVSIDGMCGVY